MKRKSANPVAKYAGDFNHARVYRDRKNDYRRGPKHKGRNPDATRV